MINKEELTKKFILVDMKDAKISTEDKPIIGTSSLATCIGVLLYSEQKKRAIVAHVAPDQMEITTKIAKLMIDNDLVDSPIKYKIIPGYYEEHYNTRDNLERCFNCFTPFDEKDIPDNAIKTDEEYTCREFAFDASTGQFVTDKVSFGIDYYMVNSKDYKEKNNIKKGR